MKERLKSKKLERLMVFTLAGLVALGGVISKNTAAIVSFGLTFYLLLTSLLFDILQN